MAQIHNQLNFAFSWILITTEMRGEITEINGWKDIKLCLIY